MTKDAGRACRNVRHHFKRGPVRAHCCRTETTVSARDRAASRTVICWLRRLEQGLKCASFARSRRSLTRLSAANSRSLAVVNGARQPLLSPPVFADLPRPADPRVPRSRDHRLEVLEPGRAVVTAISMADDEDHQRERRHQNHRGDAAQRQHVAEEARLPARVNMSSRPEIQIAGRCALKPRYARRCSGLCLALGTSGRASSRRRSTRRRRTLTMAMSPLCVGHVLTPGPGGEEPEEIATPRPIRVQPSTRCA